MLIAALALAIPAWAQTGGNPSLADQQLADPVAEAQASALMQTLRCVQCQGQSIADSDAPIAGAMRHEVRQRIKNGEKPGAIRNWLVGRYGEFISFEPGYSGAGLVLWLAPLMILAGALLLARGLFRKSAE